MLEDITNDAGTNSDNWVALSERLILREIGALGNRRRTLAAPAIVLCKANGGHRLVGSRVVNV